MHLQCEQTILNLACRYRRHHHYHHHDHCGVRRYTTVSTDCIVSRIVQSRKRSVLNFATKGYYVYQRPTHGF